MAGLFRASALVGVIRVAGAAFGFLFSLLVARLAGAQGAGVFFLVTAVLTLASVVSRLGLEHSILRFAVEGGVSIKRLRHVSRIALTWVLFSSLISTLALYLAASWISRAFTEDAVFEEILRTLALAVLPLSTMAVFAALVRGAGSPVASTVIQGFNLQFSAAMLLVLLGLLGPTGLVLYVGSAYGIAVSLSALVGFVIFGRVRRRLPKASSGDHGLPSAGLIWRTSLPLLWVSIANLMLTWSDTLLLGVFRSADEVGKYAVAFRLAALLQFVLLSINTVVAPQIAARNTAQDMAGLRQLARKAAMLAVAVGLAPFLVLFLFGGHLLSIYGSEFIDARWTLAILALGQLFNLYTGPVGYLLSLTGHERDLKNNVLASLATNVALNLTLIPPYGMVGAAIASTTALVQMHLTSSLLVRKRLGFLPLPGFNTQSIVS